VLYALLGSISVMCRADGSHPARWDDAVAVMVAAGRADRADLAAATIRALLAGRPPGVQRSVHRIRPLVECSLNRIDRGPAGRVEARGWTRVFSAAPRSGYSRRDQAGTGLQSDQSSRIA
jgi:hypothetical protein